MSARALCIQPVIALLVGPRTGLAHRRQHLARVIVAVLRDSENGRLHRPTESATGVAANSDDAKHKIVLINNPAWVDGFARGGRRCFQSKRLPPF